MRLLVTGGAGFMGSNFIRMMLAKYPDVEIVNLDKLTYAGNLANLEEVADHPRYRFVQGDIRDRAVVMEAAQGADAIVNYAAETHVDRSISAPEEFLLTDVHGTFVLLEAVKELNIGRMIQISTDEVFGSLEEGEFVESSPFMPNSPYSASKAGGDMLCRAYHVTYGTPVIVTHSCNFYGPYQYPEKFIPLFITNLLEGKSVPLYGAGANVREWIYTEDHCTAVDAILRSGIPGEVYNIGTGARRTNLEITMRLLELMGLGEERIRRVTDRPGHDFRYAVNADKLRKDLGWEPLWSFEQGLQATVDWYRAHEDWWRPLKTASDPFVDK